VENPIIEQTRVGRARIDQLIQQARLGSSESLGILIESCRPYLLSIARDRIPKALQRKCGPSDLVQETSLEAQRDFSAFTGVCLEELLGWLRRILLNNAANICRGFEHTAMRELAREVEPGSGLSLSGVRCDYQTPSSLAALNEESERLEVCLRRLPSEMQTAIILRHREYLSFNEIGERMQRSAAAARKIWARAIERLQRELTASDD